MWGAWRLRTVAIDMATYDPERDGQLGLPGRVYTDSRWPTHERSYQDDWLP